jgi:hypothetical protein
MTSVNFGVPRVSADGLQSTTTSTEAIPVGIPRTLKAAGYSGEPQGTIPVIDQMHHINVDARTAVTKLSEAGDTVADRLTTTERVDVETHEQNYGASTVLIRQIRAMAHSRALLLPLAHRQLGPYHHSSPATIGSGCPTGDSTATRCLASLYRHVK